ncbi:8905_t:CDS:2, partial [Gigaspora margarita]
SDSTEVFDTFIEDTIDVPAILLSELIPPTKVNSIIEIWKYINEKQVELEFQTSQYPFIIGLDSTNNSTQTNQSFPDL